MTTAPETKHAPRQAFSLIAPKSLRFHDAKGDAKETPDTATVSIQVRTPGVVDHWHWGPMVHDMAGIEHRDRIPIDWRHDSDVQLGYADAVTADDDGLSVRGTLLSIEEGDRAGEVIRRGRLGQPYEASMHWDQVGRLEYLDEGFQTEVNGQTVEGPLTIVRRWKLRAVAICPLGVDDSTRTQFSDSDTADAVPVSFQPCEGAMTKTTDTKPAADPNQDDKPAAETKPAADPNRGTKPATEAKPQSNGDDGRSELARYMDTFGDDRGAKYFRDGIEYSDAMATEVRTLRTENADQAKEISELKSKLDAIEIGESDPIDTGAQRKDGKPAKGWNDLFRRRGG